MSCIKDSKYRGYIITYNPPPIPWRGADWQYYHEDFDGPGDERRGCCMTLQGCRADIDELILDEAE